MPDPHLTLRVSDIAAEAKDAIVVELRDPDGRNLPEFTPGAHLELHLSNGLVRQYSLCNDARERDRYLVGVGLAQESRGGSRHIHRSIRVGDTLPVTPPRNNFPLAGAAPRHDFFAGGIGITPILSMIHWCEANGRQWHLWYLVRSRQRAAFLERLRGYGDKVTLHADDEAGGLFDVAGAVSRVAGDSHIYCCGPAPLMNAVEAAAASRPADHVHFEWFTPKEPATPVSQETFTVTLARSGKSFPVPPDKSILEVLEDNGYDIPFSCREGLCATCETQVLSGIPDHRDSVLTEAEKAANKTMMICISRAKSDTLELDL
ncbi:MAG TPA: PDR/VanB family oxidoreductase [Stellaceae bacterium]|nr:PDR/VanB family oxidoreductase [Stellaceae bacterium]